MVAHNLVAHNRDAVEQIADTLSSAREIFGDELIDLLDSSGSPTPGARLRRRGHVASLLLRAPSEVGGDRRSQSASEATEATQA